MSFWSIQLLSTTILSEKLTSHVSALRGAAAVAWARERAAAAHAAVILTTYMCRRAQHQSDRV